MPIRVCVGFAGELTRVGLTQTIDSAPDVSVVGEAAEDGELVDLLRSQSADIAVLEGDPLHLGNPELIRRIKEETDSEILLLTTVAPDCYILRAATAGAVGFVSVDGRTQELIHAIKAIYRGQGFIDPSLVRYFLESSSRQTEWDSPGADVTVLGCLTPREQEVLGYVSQGYSNISIAKRLMVSENTVKTHVSRVLNKLGLRSRVEAALFVRNAHQSQEETLLSAN